MWYRARAARSFLEQSTFLWLAWQRGKKLFAEYRHGGGVLLAREDPTTYGGDVGNFVVTNRSAAQTIARTKLLSLLRQSNGVAYWDQPNNYFEQNRVWFGLALISGQLPNLARA